MVLLEAIVSWDLGILYGIQELFRSGWMDGLMTTITRFGDGGIFWIAVAACCLAARPSRKMGYSMAAALLIGLVVGNLLLKPLVARIRPFDLVGFGPLLISAPTDFSFPSGHTLHSFSCATVIWRYYRGWGWGAYLLAALIGFSRLYLFVHYPTDVLAGALLGIGIGWLAVFLIRRWEKARGSLPGCPGETR